MWKVLIRSDYGVFLQILSVYFSDILNEAEFKADEFLILPEVHFWKFSVYGYDME